MAIASVGTIATGNNKVSGSTWAPTISAQLDANNLIVVILATDNIATATGNSSTHSTMTLGSLTLTKQREYTYAPTSTALTGDTVSIWTGRAASNIASGTAFSIGFSGAIVAKAIAAWEFTTGANVTLDANATDVGTTANGTSMAISGLSSAQRLYVRGYALESSAGTTQTPTASHTAFTITSSTTTGNPTASNIGARGEFGIITGTGDTSTLADNAGAGNNRANVFLAFSESSSSTPVSGSDSEAFSDTSELAAASALVDSAALSDSSSPAPTLQRTDAWTVSEGTTGLAASSSVADSSTLSEAAVVGSATNVSANDSAALTDASSVSPALQPTDAWTVSEGTTGLALASSVTDAATFSESASVGTFNFLSTTDAWTLYEIDTTVETDDSANEATLSESSSITATPSASDPSTTTDASALAASTALVDAWIASDSSALTAASFLVDAWAAGDSSAVSAAIPVSDSTAFSESASVSSIVLVSASDSSTVADSSATTAAVAANDATSVTEISSLGGASNISTSDVATFTETAAVTGIAVNASDAWQVYETDTTIDTDDSANESTLSESSAISITASRSDSGAFSEAASVQALVLVSASDSVAFTDSSFLQEGLPAPRVHLPTAVAIAEARGEAAVQANAGTVALVGPEFGAAVVGTIGSAMVTQNSATVVVADNSSDAEVGS